MIEIILSFGIFKRNIESFVEIVIYGGDYMNKGGFSWKRATGVTNAKQKISRATGVPMTRSGRQRKVGSATGCCTVILIPIVTVIVSIILYKFI